jgi:hypothetical protein
MHITHKNLDINKFPILHEICRAYSQFRKKYTMIENNFLRAHLLQNEALCAGIRSDSCLTLADVDAPDRDPDPAPQPYITEGHLKNLKIFDLWDGQNFISKLHFQRSIGHVVHRALWDKLDKIRRAATTRYGRDPYKKCITIENFFASWKTGSKKYAKL